MQRTRRTWAARIWPVAYDAALVVAKLAIGAKLTVIDEGGGAAVAGPAPLILAANHQGHLDYDSVLVAVPRSRRRRLRYVSSELLLARLGNGPGGVAWVQRWLLRGLYAYVHRVIPVGDEVRGAAAVAAMAQALDDGDTVVIFPEGARNREPGLRPLRRGVGVLATSTATPVVPVRIDGTRDATTSRGPTRSKAQVTVRFRAPVVPQPQEAVESFLARLTDSLQPAGPSADVLEKSPS